MKTAFLSLSLLLTASWIHATEADELLMRQAESCVVHVPANSDSRQTSNPSPVHPTPYYTVHEWGTFTSVQGADGIQMAWQPAINADLPDFVYDRAKSPDPAVQDTVRFGSKGAAPVLQRLETPVLYFYSDIPRRVDVRVDFPQGLVTEWYPSASEVGPTAPKTRAKMKTLPAESVSMMLTFHPDGTELVSGRPSMIRWPSVFVVPPAADIPLMGGPDSVPAPNSTENVAPLPTDARSSHYYAARETEASRIRISVPQTNGMLRTEMEKFLFYRGVGSFTAPLQASLEDDGKTLQLKNQGNDDFPALLVIQMEPKGGRLWAMNWLGKQQSQSVSLTSEAGLTPLPELTAQVGQFMENALIKAGLFAPEAAAMVKTWQNSWFTEPGLRVLYLLPQPWVDRTLPLTIKPKPQSTARVFVGRAEVITPQVEQTLRQLITQYHSSTPGSREAAIAATRALGLGRFLQPAMLRTIDRLPAELSGAGYDLIREISQPVSTSGKVALK